MPHDQNDSRLRRIWIAERELLTLFLDARCGVAECWQFPIFDTLPEGYRVKAALQDFATGGIMFAVQHDTFDVVPPGREIPIHFDPLTGRVEMRLVERAPLSNRERWQFDRLKSSAPMTTDGVPVALGSQVKVWGIEPGRYWLSPPLTGFGVQMKGGEPTQVLAFIAWEGGACQTVGKAVFSDGVEPLAAGTIDTGPPDMPDPIGRAVKVGDDTLTVRRWRGRLWAFLHTDEGQFVGYHYATDVELVAAGVEPPPASPLLLKPDTTVVGTPPIDPDWIAQAQADSIERVSVATGRAWHVVGWHACPVCGDAVQVFTNEPQPGQDDSAVPQPRRGRRRWLKPPFVIDGDVWRCDSGHVGVIRADEHGRVNGLYLAGAVVTVDTLRTPRPNEIPSADDAAEQPIERDTFSGGDQPQPGRIRGGDPTTGMRPPGDGVAERHGLGDYGNTTGGLDDGTA